MRRAIVVGAGIVGLAVTKALVEQGYRVTVLERSTRAMGASVRNFGMVWPIGQPDGDMYENAIRSREIWLQVCTEANIWYDRAGSLHLAYNGDELDVLTELADIYSHRQYRILSPDKTKKVSPVVNARGLLGSLHSSGELIVDPREAIQKLADWLTEKRGVTFLWGVAATDVTYPSVYSGKEEFEADLIYICSGTDFETLFPEIYAQFPLIRCKLQMMRMEAQPDTIGPAICGGLSLTHYESFKAAASLQALKMRYKNELADYIKFGIHVMAAQNRQGEITIGDSHEYSTAPDPFDKAVINNLIIDYLNKLTTFSNTRIIQSWNGIYSKLIDGEMYLVAEPEQGVTIINGVGGAGMTLSFALCEKAISGKFVC